jgi:histidinol-phosphate aminotransferase
MERGLTATLFPGYEEGLRTCAIDLSDNTNQWGTAPSATQVLRSFDRGRLARYPSAYSPQLKQAISRYIGTDTSMIVTGCGSDDVLDSAIRALAEPGDEIVMASPTFSMIPVFARVSRVVPREVQLFDENVVDELLAARAAITYLCSPNNPTGTILQLAEIKRIAEGARGVVIVDQAYVEFGGDDAIELTTQFDNVLVTRTLSKAFGLAGCRIGYGIASRNIIDRIEGARGPYKITAVSEAAAIAALDNDINWVRDRVGECRDNRTRFIRELDALGFETLPSQANFVLVPVSDARVLAAALADRGIAVRALQNLATVGDAVRISIGQWEVMDQCLAALREFSR